MNTITPPLPVLLVDDENQLLRSTAIALRTSGIEEIATLNDAREVAPFLERQPVAAALLDLNMPHVSGEALLQNIKENHPEIPVIILTAANEIEVAVRCMRLGAEDYLVKPVEKARLLSSVKRVLETRALTDEIDDLRCGLLQRKIKNPHAFSHIIGDHETLVNLFCYIEAIANTPQPILITGETGTGKELFAKSTHLASGKQGPFVAVTVSGLDDINFSDTLFGHKKGAFTGADNKRQGLIASAQNGTLFLDEIGDLSPSSQVKLLRLIQEREYYPLGEDQPRHSNARIVVASHVDLAKAVKNGRFRQDLYYRLRPHHVHIPPLRERLEDIPALTDFFVERSAAQMDRKAPTVPPALYQLLCSYHFPGNVRELEGMVTDAIARQSSPILSLNSFRLAMGLGNESTANRTFERTQEETPILQFPDTLPPLKVWEEALIQEALRRADDNQGIAASLLGITRQALNKRLVRQRERK